MCKFEFLSKMLVFLRKKVNKNNKNKVLFDLNFPTVTPFSPSSFPNGLMTPVSSSLSLRSQWLLPFSEGVDGKKEARVWQLESLPLL